MKQNVLGMEPQAFAAKISRSRGIMIAAALVTVALNVLFTLLRTERTHTWMLLLNIGADILGGGFLIFWGCLFWAPARKIHRLWNGNRETLRGTVVEISAETRWHYALECRTVQLEDRTVFLPVQGNMQLQPGRQVILSLAMNMVMEAQVHEETNR